MSNGLAMTPTQPFPLDNLLFAFIVVGCKPGVAFFDVFVITGNLRGCGRKRRRNDDLDRAVRFERTLRGAAH